MVNGFDLAENGINRLIQTMIDDGVTVREINTMLLGSTIRRWIDEVGEETLCNVLQGSINQIEEGAYRAEYVAPEATMADDEEARQARLRLTVIEGGGGSKV